MKVCFTGGGSAGHVFPAFPVDESLSQLCNQAQTDYDRFWIGTRSPRERDWVQRYGIPFYSIPTGKLRRYWSLKTGVDMFCICLGILFDWRLLFRLRPSIVFSKGGFASVPVVLASWLLGIPCVTHESDASVGLANRINSRFVRMLCLSCKDDADRYMGRKGLQVRITGLPVRFQRFCGNASLAIKRFELDPSYPLVLVIGGSQGALQLNLMVWENLEMICEHSQVVHQTGGKGECSISRLRYCKIDFIAEGLEDLLAAADLVVSRAGATAIAECVEMGVPMVLVPLGMKTSRGDQILNARNANLAGAAVVIDEDGSDKAVLGKAIVGLLQNHDRLHSMVRSCDALRTPGAAMSIAKAIVDASVMQGRKG